MARRTRSGCSGTCRTRAPVAAKMALDSGGRDGGRARLAHAGRILGARDDVHLDDVGQVAHAEDLVGVEVLLLERALGDGALLLERVGEAEEERALHLGADAVRD